MQPECLGKAESSSVSDDREGAQSIAAQCSPANIETPVPGDKQPEKEMVSPADPISRVNQILRGLCLVLAHHGVPQPVMNSFRTQVTTYLSVPDEQVFFKRAKYLTVAYMAKYLRCEPPKKPDQDFCPTGAWKAWSQHRLRVFSRRNTHLWYSFLQSKRAAAPLSDELVLTTYKEHRAAMEQADPLDAATCEIVMKELKPVLNKIKKQVQRKLGSQSRGADFMETKHVASTSACFEASRTKGGQLGSLTELVPTVSTCNPLNPAERRSLPDLVRMTFYPRVVVNGVVKLNHIVEEYEYTSAQAEWRNTLTSLTSNYVPKVYVKEKWHNRERYLILTEKPKRLRCTIQAVLEPLKVRVISKGEAVPYYLSKPLQEALHSTMREMDCFRLIGRPLCPTDLCDLAANRVQGGEGREEWFSIDYSAATDKLSARLSKSILTYLVDGMDPTLVEMWKAVLAPHKCQYPFPYNQEVAPVIQQNGQLMGSILSFPILCLANLGLYLTAIRDDTRSLRKKLQGVLVNGDDMLYVAKSSRWTTHVELGSRVGLSMSPGKAYHHPVYANANSACYHYDLSNERSTPYAIPFLNSGLYFGQSKVMGGDDYSPSEGRCSTINKLLAGCLPGKQCEVLKGFLHRHSGVIADECKGRNLFIPESLGGMGVHLPDGWKTVVTIAQREVATRKWKSQPYLHWGDGPAVGPCLKEAPQPLSAPWLAGIHFETDEDGELLAVPKESRVRRLEIGAREVARLQSQNSTRGMLPDRKLFLTTHTCAVPLNKGVVRESHTPSGGNQFLRRFRQDYMVSSLLDSLVEYERVADSIKNNPWIGVSRQLDAMMVWDEFISGEMISVC